MEQEIKEDLAGGNSGNIRIYAAYDDTYIRKNAYSIMGRLYRDHPELRARILDLLEDLFKSDSEKVRQTAVYAADEIGRTGERCGTEIDDGTRIFEIALADERRPVRNAVIGALKRMGEKNPEPTLYFARTFLHHHDPAIRRAVVHGIELRGRTHPEEILPLLTEVQSDPDKDVRRMVIHVLGQISYKKGCLEKVVLALKGGGDEEMVKMALKEILSVHKRYERFSARSLEEALEYLKEQFTYPEGKRVA